MIHGSLKSAEMKSSALDKDPFKMARPLTQVYLTQPCTCTAEALRCLWWLCHDWEWAWTRLLALPGESLLKVVGSLTQINLTAPECTAGTVLSLVAVPRLGVGLDQTVALPGDSYLQSYFK
jgi:hypothetical protein